MTRKEKSEAPTMGRIVHYGGAPAIVTKVHDDGSVNLTVFHDEAGTGRVKGAVEGEGGWNWPPRD